VGADPETDVAVIRLPAEGLTEIPVADSDQLRVGDFVVAIGSPFGLAQTVTSGIVSALGRTGLGIEGYEDFIQTDASINPGNSGGALVDLRGRLVGINTAILGPSGGNVGIGFAIPSNMAMSLTEQLVRHGQVKRGQLGVTAQDLDPKLAEAFDLDPLAGGAVIVKVRPDSPAARAGLRSGDVVTEIDGRSVGSSAELRNRVGLLRAGQSVELTVVRDGRARKVRVRLEEPSQVQIQGESLHPRLAGTVFADISPQSPLYDRIEGVEVADVRRGSPAAATGLRPGDVITTINRRPVKRVADLEKLAGLGDRTLLLNVQRGRNALFVLVQ
jgi:serine protease Do/serine protease DegQ